MKKIILLLLIVSTQIFASEPLKIGVITDIHYLSDKLMDNGSSINNYVRTTGKNVKATPEVLEAVTNDLVNSNIEILLVCGDMTKDGEKLSHLDFRRALEPLYNKGVKIFVIPGNHDINIPNPLKYAGERTDKTDNISASEFTTIYKDYGFNAAIDRDTSSLSYFAELNDEYSLLAIDVARYAEHTTKSISSGKLKMATEKWIIEGLHRARVGGKQVIAIMHWGLVEHIPMQAEMFKDYLVEDNNRIANLLADNGVKMIFTGHFHSNDISMFESSKGNKIYDIETGALVSYPFAYRIIDLNKVGAVIETRNITSIPSEPNLAEDSKSLMKQIASDRAANMLKQLGFNFSADQSQRLAKIIGELFILHLKGDEIVSDTTKQAMTKIFEEAGFPIDETMTNLDLDFYPADNNVKIIFE